MNNPGASKPVNKTIPPPSTLSLRAKLVLSYLFVIFGTVLVLSIVVSLASQNYYTGLQKQRLQTGAQYVQQYIQQNYPADMNGSIWVQAQPGDVLIYQDAATNNSHCLIRSCSNLDPAVASQALSEAQQGQETSFGTMTSTTDRGEQLTSNYISVPVRVNNQIVGALFFSEPQITPDQNFMGLINQTIFVTGFLVAVVAGLCSFLLIHRFIRPLEALTRAAEQMKQGKYTQRVEIPKSLDELGELALTFNEMADTIEADVNELRRQDQVRRDLVANIAHDLATPLTAIQGLSEALADDVISEPSARQETGQRIGREIQRLRRLVADVRQMSSLEAGHAHLDLAPLDMHALVDETITVIAPECEQMHIAVHNTVSPITPLVQADSDRIAQVLLNLLDNARRHTLAGGQIYVSARPQGKNLSISISDTGVGIEPADLPHIFERFYRADRSRAARTGGSGLGLSIVKAIITAHGGAVWAESQPGQGTRITFTLPIVQDAAMLHMYNTRETAPLLMQQSYERGYPQA